MNDANAKSAPTPGSLLPWFWNDAGMTSIEELLSSADEGELNRTGQQRLAALCRSLCPSPVSVVVEERGCSLTNIEVRVGGSLVYSHKHTREDTSTSEPVT